MGLYDDLQTVAQNVLAEFNQGVIRYGVITSGAGTADEPGKSSIAWTTLSGAVAGGVQSQYVAAGLAIASDLQTTMAVQTGIVPAQKDFVEIDGERYKVENIIAKPAAGTPVVYTLIVRR